MQDRAGHKGGKRMYYFIVNYRGGNGRGQKVWKSIRAILEAENIPYHAWRTRGRGHAAFISQSSAEQDPEADRKQDHAAQNGGGTRKFHAEISSDPDPGQADDQGDRQYDHGRRKGL